MVSFFAMLALPEGDCSERCKGKNQRRGDRDNDALLVSAAPLFAPFQIVEIDAQNARRQLKLRACPAIHSRPGIRRDGFGGLLLSSFPSAPSANLSASGKHSDSMLKPGLPSAAFGSPSTIRARIRSDSPEPFEFQNLLIDPVRPGCVRRANHDQIAGLFKRARDH